MVAAVKDIRASDIHTSAATAPELYAQMEDIQSRVPEKNMEIDLSPTAYKNIPLPVQQEAVQVLDQIADNLGQESISRRLSKLMARVAAVIERYTFRKKQEQHEKKMEIESGNLIDQQMWKNRQGWTQMAGGFGSAFLSVAGAMLGGNVGSIFDAMSRLTPEGARALSTWMDGYQVPLSHHQSLFIQLASSDRQALEGIKNLPRELQQLIQRLLDLELQANRAIMQR